MYLYVLLVSSIIDLKEKETIIDKQVSSVEETTQEEQEIEITKTSSCIPNYADVTRYLMANDLDKVFVTLRNHLESIGKKQYEFLIVDLIKISLLEGDIAFSKPGFALVLLAHENFLFDISKYIQCFYENLAQNNFDIARLYLDIISKANELGQKCILTDNLESILEMTEKTVTSKQNKKVNSPIVEKTQVIETTPTIEENWEEIPKDMEIIPDVSSNKNIVLKNKPVAYSKVFKKPNDDNDREFINQKLEEIRNNGLILLKPMDNERINNIHNIVKSIPDVVSFTIGSGNKRQVVLRHRPYIGESFDVRKVMNTGYEAYKNGDYDTCINLYRQYLMALKEIKNFVYARLGISYMKAGYRKIAIDYLTVATELSKFENEVFDFTSLIASLSGKANNEEEEEIKPRVKMEITDFKNDTNDYYGIEGIKQVAEFVSLGMSIDDACLKLGLNEEQKSIVSLILAREYYMLEKYTKGDEFIKKVEKTKNKSKFVKSLLEEVRKNKQFYKNRIQEEQSRLVLIPKK